MAALTLKTIRLSSLALGTALALAAPALAVDVSVKLDAGTGFSIKNSTGTIERLRVDEATGNLSRNGALFVHTTGANNTFVGAGAGNPSTSGAGFNSAFGQGALAANTTGVRNDAFGQAALSANTLGSRNSAFGTEALRSNTAGSYNTAVGAYSLRDNTTGSESAAFGEGALLFNSTGSFNAAFGAAALLSNTTGTLNSAFGRRALFATTTGSRNSAFGADALRFNTASYNAAFGNYALRDNTTGKDNTAVGQGAMISNTSGQGNTAVGQRALFENTTGGLNVGIGALAGLGQQTGSNNIYIQSIGVDGESGQIKIGISGIHTQATIIGIHGRTSAGGVGVFVNSNGVLGTTTSSARFKQDVRDMGAASDVLMKLRPVTFRYREDAVGAEEAQVEQYGLIAEEVAEVAPELVAPDAEGKPYSVKYHELPALLLNEVQEQQRTIEKQAGMIEAQRLEMQVQQGEHEKQIAALTTRLARLEAHAR